jgi:hypothetical protein
MSISVITTFPRNAYSQYAERMIDSFIFHWSKSINLYVYYEDEKPPKINFQCKKIDLLSVAPDLIAFKEKYKNDPVANGDIIEIPNGVRRSSFFVGADKNKKTFLFDAVRFAHKTFCVDHAIKNIDSDMILWLDSDTYTFANVTEEFVRSTLPEDKMVCYLGREKEKQWPECGWVGYNKNHPQLTEFMKRWTDLYNKDTIFDEMEWHDSYVWYKVLLRMNKDLGHDLGAGIPGKHIFINSVLGKYIDHLKGNRKEFGKSFESDWNK